jgi:periplasmic copper chaperone A
MPRALADYGCLAATAVPIGTKLSETGSGMKRKTVQSAGRALAPLIGILALAVPAGAGAHVRLQPEEAPAGAFTVLDVNVPDESGELATTKVELRFPPGFLYVLHRPVPGWSAEVKMARLATPITTGGQAITERVSRVIWTARGERAEIQPEQFQDFSIGVQIPGRAGDTLTFKALQTYEDGEVVRWIGAPESQLPAPQIVVTDGGSQAGAGAGESGPADGSGGDSDGVAIVALVVAMLALLTGGVAAARSLRTPAGSWKTSEGSKMPTQTQVISGTDFITVSTEDYERAAKFYGETLGLRFSKRWGTMPAGEFETGNLTIAVMQSDAFGIEFRANNHPIEFHVDDFEAAKGELESRGVEFKGDILDSGVCHQAFFSDPDGNALAIHHRHAAPDAAPGA